MGISENIDITPTKVEALILNGKLLLNSVLRMLFLLKSEKEEVNMMKKMFLFTTLGLISALLFSCTPSKQYDLESETKIVVGLEAAYAPFNWAEVSATEFTMPLSNQPGSYVDGYDVSIAKLIGAELNKTVEFKAIDWLGLIPALNSRDINIIIAGMSPTEVRKQEISFSDEYYRSEIVMIVRGDGDYRDATSIDDFAGARVVAQISTIYDEVIDQIPDVVHQTPLDDYASLALAVSSGSADAFVAEMPVAISVVNTNPNLHIVSLTAGGFATLDEDITVAIGVRKIDTDLLAALNSALGTITQQTRDTLMNEALSRSGGIE